MFVFGDSRIPKHKQPIDPRLCLFAQVFTNSVGQNGRELQRNGNEREDQKTPDQIAVEEMN